MTTTWSDLVPTEVVGELITALEQTSVAMQLGHVIRMTAGQASVPVSKTAPQAGFVTPPYGGRKPLAQIDWTAERLVAEEIAATCAIPDSFIDDSGIPVWEMIQGEFASAIAVALDQAVLFGVNAPVSYPVGGVAAKAQPPVSVVGDPAAALDGAMSAVEATGLTPTGIAGSPLVRGAIRSIASHQLLVPVSDPATYAYFGLPLVTTPVWDSTKGDAIVGDWSKLLVGIREDITIDLSQEGVLLNPDGTIAVSAFADDMTLMRIYTRVGVAIGTPGKPDGSGPTRPFAAASWPAAAGAQAKASK
jgi:HK97 family phage major capsid protein